MASAPLRNQNPGHEIYEPRKDNLASPGRAKFGDFPGTNAAYSADHLPIFADLVLRDENDGFSDDTTGPSLGWIVPSNSLTFVNRPVASAPEDVFAYDNLDPSPVVTCYPLNPTYTLAGTKKITYLARDRHGNMATMDRTVTVAAWGQGGLTHNLQWPPAMQIPVSGQGTVYAQIQIPGWTETVAKVAPNVRCWVGVNAQNTAPTSWPETVWKEASVNVAQGIGTNADEYMVSLSAGDFGAGNFYYATRWQINGGTYGYGGISSAGAGGAWDGTTYLAGVLTVGNTIGSWSSNAPVTSELVQQYAIGGASSPTGASVPPSLAIQADGDGQPVLAMAVLVRTDDPLLNVQAEAVGSLGDLGNPGRTTVVTGIPTVDQSGVPEGFQRQVFNVPATANRQFLRLKVTR
jgi:hypothetical protein